MGFGITDNGAISWDLSELSGSLTDNELYSKIINLISTLWISTDMPYEEIKKKTDEYINECDKVIIPSDKNNFIALMLMFCLYRRNPRSGQGRRDESRGVLIPFVNKYYKDNPTFAKKLIELYIASGYWGDAMKLLTISKNDPLLLNLVTDIIVDQLTRDKSSINASLCAKWCPTPRVMNSKKSKDRVSMSILIAKRLFPDIKENSWYYKYKDGKLDNTTKFYINSKTPHYFKWRTLLERYTEYIKELRKKIQYVEKDMNPGSFSNIKHTTSLNKLRYDRALKNLPPKYFTEESKIPKSKIKVLKKKYSSSYESGERCNSDDRRECARNIIKYENEANSKLLEKQKLIEDVKQKIKDCNDPDPITILEAELAKLVNKKVISFDTGTPVDVYKSYGDSREVNLMYESCINELALNKFSNISNMEILCVADTSGSMYSGNGSTSPISACIALTAFIAKNAPITYRHKFIQFSSKAYVIDMVKEMNKDDITFIEYISYMKSHQVNDMSTNFESVINTLRVIFKNNTSQIPKYLLFFSDMQFDQAVNLNSELTAQEHLNELFMEELECEVSPTIVFWNLNCKKNSPAKMDAKGCVILSGYSPCMLLDLHNIVSANVNTWKTLVKTLTESKACSKSLKDIREYINHTFV